MQDPVVICECDPTLGESCVECGHDILIISIKLLAHNDVGIIMCNPDGMAFVHTVVDDEGEWMEFGQECLSSCATPPNLA